MADLAEEDEDTSLRRDAVAAGDADAASSPKRAPAAPEDVSTVSRKRKMSSLAEVLDATEGAAEEDEDGVQCTVDRALAALVEAHKVDNNIFYSEEWVNLLEALNQGPLPAVDTVFEANPVTILARAAIHQLQANC